MPRPQSARTRGESEPRTPQEGGDGDNGDPRLTLATQEGLWLPNPPVGSITPHAGTLPEPSCPFSQWPPRWILDPSKENAAPGASWGPQPK